MSKSTMVDKQALCRYMGDLISAYDSKVARTAIETLLTIHRNILYNETEVHYRSINPENPIINQKIWSVVPARQFMKKCGWIPAHNRYFFNSDEALVDIIEILVEYRNAAQPQENEWVEHTKIMTKSEEKQRDEELRKKAALEREKELAEFQKDKKFRDDLAKKVRAEVEADNRRRRQLQRNEYPPSGGR